MLPPMLIHTHALRIQVLSLMRKPDRLCWTLYKLVVPPLFRTEVAIETNTSAEYVLGGGLQDFPPLLALHSSIHRRQALSHPRLPKHCNEITFASIYNYLKLTSDGEEFPLFVCPFQDRQIVCFGKNSFLNRLAVADFNTHFTTEEQKYLFPHRISWTINNYYVTFLLQNYSPWSLLPLHNTYQLIRTCLNTKFEHVHDATHNIYTHYNIFTTDENACFPHLLAIRPLLFHRHSCCCWPCCCWPCCYCPCCSRRHGHGITAAATARSASSRILPGGICYTTADTVTFGIALLHPAVVVFNIAAPCGVAAVLLFWILEFSLNV